MSQAVADLQAEFAVLKTNVDTLLTGYTAQVAQISALQLQVAGLPDATADKAALVTMLADMQAEAAKVVAAVTPASTV